MNVAPAKAEAAALVNELRAHGSAENLAGMARFGIETGRAFGISMATLKPIARRVGRSHSLALALWRTGHHEARLLAVLVDEPDKGTARQMVSWAAAFDSWDLCDQACMKLFARTPFVAEKVAAWADDDREFVRRAAFALMAGYAVHGKDAPDSEFVRYLPLIERWATDPRNFVKKAVNWALRQVGKHSLALHRPALSLARKLAASSDATARWIGRDAVRELTDPVQLNRMMKRRQGPPASRRGSGARA